MVLAAGRSTRMPGGAKLLRGWMETTVIRQVVVTALTADLHPVVVVVRRDRGGVRDALRDETVLFAEVPQAPQGRLVSVCAGLDALASSGVEEAVILLGDEPGMRAEHVSTVLAARVDGSPAALRANFTDRPGHPVFLPPEVTRSIRRLAPREQPDSGLWDVIVRSGLPHASVPIDELSPIDIDSPIDFARAVERERGP